MTRQHAAATAATAAAAVARLAAAAAGGGDNPGGAARRRAARAAVRSRRQLNLRSEIGAAVTEQVAVTVARLVEQEVGR